MASLLLTSCADQSEPIQDKSKSGGTDTKPQANLTILTPPVPKVGSVIKNKALTLSRVTEDIEEPATEVLPPATVSGKTSSLSSAPEISKLIGLNSVGLNRLLGKPLLVRREAEAEVWQYSTAKCVLHLFLYRDSVNKLPYRVVHMEANHRKLFNTARASVDLNSLERKKLIKSCFSRLFYRAKTMDNRG